MHRADRGRAPPDPTLDLASRTGLPDALRVLLEAHPRESWVGHSNFNDLTRFWLDRHLLFRRLLARLEADAAGYLDGAADPRAFATAVHRGAGLFINELHGHHSIEDHHYFPTLATFDCRLERGFTLLDADHRALHEHLESLTETANGVLRGLAEGRAEREAERYRRAVSGFDRFLDRHLTDEEEIVVPVILAHGFGHG